MKTFAPHAGRRQRKLSALAAGLRAALRALRGAPGNR